jgi:L-cysteine:1D-myo-inositol 2-amino-2-deoxy-alpha-D-glucopyranoside ligase
MRAWPAPQIPTLPIQGPPVALYDTQRRTVAPAMPASGPASLYVCGITPYDATHMGHANTYVAFDLLNRAWRCAGLEVTYAQNVTDVDDPLLERATLVGIDWVALAERETELFRQDMTALRVVPPAFYTGAVESVPLIVEFIERLDAAGAVYRVEDDLYFSVGADDAFGEESGMGRAEMLEIFPQRGGDPDRPGKKDPLDALLWRAERPGEPSWESPFGPGRPGWHVECAAIALDHLGTAFTVQGGGSDLIFPHHEMCAGHAHVAGCRPFAEHYVHAGMVAYDGEKMSKSRGNLVFVSALRNSEVDPMAIRLTLLRHHYRSDWEWTEDQLWASVDTLETWREALTRPGGAAAEPVVRAALAALAEDLDAPSALAAIEGWVAATLAGEESDTGAPGLIRDLLDAALGLAL